MPLTKLQFRPGINRETTDYTNEGGWFDCDKVRFRAGLPETIGGWTRYTDGQFLGTCRSIFNWVDLDQTVYSGLGTNLKFYIVEGGQVHDITPIRRTVTLGTDPLETEAAGSGVLIVTDIDHGALLNDFVTFTGATTTDGIDASLINTELQITEVIDSDTYKVDTGGSASTGSVSGGGSSVDAAYQINTGLDFSVFGTGWGADPWSAGGYGSPGTSPLAGAQLRVWTQDNYGEDLLFCPRDGGIYYWDTSVGVSTRAVSLASLPGATDTPTVAKVIMQSERDNHIIAFGCDSQFNPGVQDALLIRFSDQSLPLTDWNVASAENTAGELRIGSGSEIITAVQTKQQILILTDSSAHTMQYIGPPYIFGVGEVSTNISVISPMSAVAVGDAVYWMGRGEFYAYNGVVTPMPCSVKEYVFNNMNTGQSGAVFAASNTAFGEVWWFYPSVNSTNIDSYVVYNYEQQVWYYGTLSRTAWADRSVLQYPIAAASDGYLYYHEFGLNDGAQNPPASIAAFIESSTFDIGEGDQFMFASRVIPDITFRNSTSANPTATLTIKARNFPGANYIASNTNSVIKTASVPVEQFTEQVFVRLRGRSMALRVDSNTTDTAWRLGSPRIDFRPDGRK